MTSAVLIFVIVGKVSELAELSILHKHTLPIKSFGLSPQIHNLFSDPLLLAPLRRTNDSQLLHFHEQCKCF